MTTDTAADDLELKKWVLTTAASIQGITAEAALAAAVKFYDFLTKDIAVSVTVSQGTSIVVQKNFKVLTDAQVRILRETIAFYQKGERFNASDIGRSIKMSQANISHHMRHLILTGHVRRISGTKYQPMYKPCGSPMETRRDADAGRLCQGVQAAAGDD